MNNKAESFAKGIIFVLIVTGIFALAISFKNENNMTGNAVGIPIGSKIRFTPAEIKELMTNLQLDPNPPNPTRKENDGSHYNGPIYKSSASNIIYYIKFPKDETQTIQIIQEDQDDRYRDLVDFDFFSRHDPVKIDTNIYDLEEFGVYSQSLVTDDSTFRQAKQKADNNAIKLREEALEKQGINVKILIPDHRNILGLNPQFPVQTDPTYFTQDQQGLVSQIISSQQKAKQDSSPQLKTEEVSKINIQNPQQGFTVTNVVKDAEGKVTAYLAVGPNDEIIRTDSQGNIEMVSEVRKDAKGKPILNDKGEPTYQLVSGKKSVTAKAASTSDFSLTEEQISNYRKQATDYMNQGDAAKDPNQKARLYSLAAEFAAKAGDTAEAESFRNKQSEALASAAKYDQPDEPLKLPTKEEIEGAQKSSGTKIPTKAEELDAFTGSLFGSKKADTTTKTGEKNELTYDQFISSFNKAASEAKATEEQKTAALEKAASEFENSNPNLAGKIYNDIAGKAADAARKEKDAKKKMDLYQKSIDSYNKAGDLLTDPAQKAKSYKDAFLNNLDIIQNSGLSQSEKNKEIKRLQEEYDKKIPEITATDEASKKLKAEVEKQKNIIDNTAFLNTPNPFLEGLYNKIKGFTGFFEGYSGASFFYTDDGFIYEQIDNEWARALLGGIPGVASEICKNDVLDDLNGNNGYAFSESTAGASAHIEGEKITVKNYTNTSSTTFYIYKISFEVDPGTAAAGCDITFRAYLGRGTLPLVVSNASNAAYQWSVTRGNSSVSYAGTNMIVKQSKKKYNEVCLYFDSINPRAGGTCLVGVDEGTYLCNQIKEGAEQSFDQEDFEHSNSWWSSVSYWDGGGGSEVSSNNQESQTRGERIQESVKSKESPSVNPDI